MKELRLEHWQLISELLDKASVTRNLFRTADELSEYVGERIKELSVTKANSQIANRDAPAR